MSDSVRPHRRQPTRLHHPWDSPGQDTGVGCHFLLQCMKVESESEVAQSCRSLSDPMDCSPPGSSVHGIFQARVLEWGAVAFSKYLPSWQKLRLLIINKIEYIYCLVTILVLKSCCWITQRLRGSWPPEEKNSIRGQRRGLIAQRFRVIRFY